MFLHLSICSVSLTVVSTISLIFFNILCIAHCLRCALYRLFSVTLTVALYYLCFFQYSLYHLYFLVFPVTLTVVGILCIIYIRQYALYITLICLYALYHSVCTLCTRYSVLFMHVLLFCAFPGEPALRINIYFRIPCGLCYARRNVR